MPEQRERWYADRRDFSALLYSHATRASRSPRFRLCSPEIRKKLHLLRSNSLRSTERNLVYPSISVIMRQTKKYGTIRKRIQMQFTILHYTFFTISNKQKGFQYHITIFK